MVEMTTARKAFVTGFPIKHSRSPLIHRFWLKQLGIEGRYDAIEIAPDDFSTFVSSFGKQGFVGGNVTIPHKEAAFKAAEKLDDAAKAIGAVNTLWFEAGTLWGGNTDAYGFAANLDACAPGWDNAEKALVLGAGGASRAVIHALITRGFSRITVANRTLSRAEALSAHFGAVVSARGWDEAQAHVAEADLIVNTTSLGMSGNSDETAFPLDLTSAPKHAVATDIVYVPLKTPFLKQAEQAGLKSIDGLGMLLHQAVPGFEHWFGVRPEVSVALRNHILDDMKKAGSL